MEKTELTLTYTEELPALGKAVRPKKEPKKPFPWKTLGQTVCFCLAGVFWGRAEVLQILHPMGLGYLSAFLGEGWLFCPVWLAVGVGAFAHVPLKAGPSPGTFRICSLQPAVMGGTYLLHRSGSRVARPS